MSSRPSHDGSNHRAKTASQSTFHSRKPYLNSYKKPGFHRKPFHHANAHEAEEDEGLQYRLDRNYDSDDDDVLVVAQTNIVLTLKTASSKMSYVVSPKRGQIAMIKLSPKTLLVVFMMKSMLITAGWKPTRSMVSSSTTNASTTGVLPVSFH